MTSDVEEVQKEALSVDAPKRGFRGRLGKPFRTKPCEVCLGKAAETIKFKGHRTHVCRPCRKELRRKK